nr:cysteine peptidase family C39 domain-containing protein [Ferrovibrio sp.]
MTCSALRWIARILGRPVDAGQLLHRYGRHDTAATAIGVVRAGRDLDLKIRKVVTGWQHLASTPLPAIACLKGGSFVVLAALRGGREKGVDLTHTG